MRCKSKRCIDFNHELTYIIPSLNNIFRLKNENIVNNWLELCNFAP